MIGRSRLEPEMLSSECFFILPLILMGLLRPTLKHLPILFFSLEDGFHLPLLAASAAISSYQQWQISSVAFGKWNPSRLPIIPSASPRVLERDTRKIGDG